MRYCPLFFDTAPYEAPVEVLTARIIAPGRTTAVAPVLPFTMPVMDPVVTPCADRTDVISVSTRRREKVERSSIGMQGD
jgi:hypothetical protein